MTQFWIQTGVLIGLVTLLLVMGLIRQKSLALAGVLALLIPISTLWIYNTIGRPDALGDVVINSSAFDPQQPTSEEMFEQLANRVAVQPDDHQAWFFLGRLHTAKQDFKSASNAYGQAARLVPNDPLILTEWAGALLLSGRSDGPIAVEAIDAVERALQLDPEQEKALWLRGIMAFQQARYGDALKDWQKLQSLLESDNPIVQSLSAQIEQAKALLQDPDTMQATPIDTKPQLTIRVHSPQANGSGSVLYVFARAEPSGPPLAVRRIANPTFPLTLSLSDADRMRPDLSLNAASGPLFVTARLSESGNALPQSGDRFGTQQAQPGEPIEITIDQVVESR